MPGSETPTPPPELVAVARHIQDLVTAEYARRGHDIDPAYHDELTVAILVDCALENPGAQLDHRASFENTHRPLSRLTRAYPDAAPAGFGSAASATAILLLRDGDRLIATGHDNAGNHIARNAVRIAGHAYWIDGTRGRVSVESGVRSGVYAARTGVVSRDLGTDQARNAGMDVSR